MDGNNTSSYSPFPDIQTCSYLTYVTSRELKLLSRHCTVDMFLLVPMCYDIQAYTLQVGSTK